MSVPVCRNLSLIIFISVLMGCSAMKSYKLEERSSGFSIAPPTDPTDPGRPSSGLVTPFASMVPDREVWVAPYGDDLNAGTLFEPKLTIGAALRIATAGTAVMVKAGNYDESVNITGAVSGTSAKPIWIRSADGKWAAHIVPLTLTQEGLRIVGSDNIVVEGMKIKGGVAIVEDASANYSQNIVLQNNLIYEGYVDGVSARFTRNLYVMANEVLSCLRGQGIALLGVNSGAVVDNFVHDLHSSTGVNDGINTKGDTREMLLMNNYIEHVDGHAISLEGLNLSVKSSSLNGAKGAALVTGCSGCSFERNEIVNTVGKPGIELRIGDSPVHATANIKLLNNCVNQSNWLSVEQGAEVGLTQQNNTSTACR